MRPAAAGNRPVPRVGSDAVAAPGAGRHHARMNPFNIALTLGIVALLLGAVALTGGLLRDGSLAPGLVALAVGAAAIAVAVAAKRKGRDEDRLPPADPT